MKFIFEITSLSFSACSIWLIISWMKIFSTQKTIDIQDVMSIVLVLLALILSITIFLVSLFHKED